MSTYLPLILRITSGLMLIFALGHTAGARKSWSPLGETPVLQSMRTFTFDVMGQPRSYWDFYMGFGLIISVLMLLEAVLLWQLASLARTDAARARPMIATLFAASVLTLLVSWRFIFLIPTLFSLAIAICLALALFAAPAAPRGVA